MKIYLVKGNVKYGGGVNQMRGGMFILWILSDSNYIHNDPTKL